MDLENNVKMEVTASEQLWMDPTEAEVEGSSAKAEATMVKEDNGAEKFKEAPWKHVRQEIVDDNDDIPKWADDWATEVWEQHSQKQKFPWWDTRQKRNMHSSPYRD